VRGDTSFPVRLRFSKRGRVRFISHRDVARAFERAFRIVQLPLAFTEWFSPRPRVSFGLALSVGYESDAEYLDVALARPIDLGSLASDLSDALPAGIDVAGVGALADRAPALQEVVTAAAYRVAVSVAPPAAAGGLATAVAGALARSELPVTIVRKGQETVEDIRPAIRRLTLVDTDVLDLEVATQPRGVRPAEVVRVLGDDFDCAHVLRTHQWIERLGARLEPLEADRRPHALEARAS
jgi:radical SAM-linked protein